ncbi:auxin-responsive protein SAUR32-like [Cucurbita moschata]|uniref:Auxin-responsive protein SAUR32-like n=1 Tax=Cucurbita moschata TaxID=3662 RepID=A0A6J1EBA0_CUCMO|nr:auxin-responsive protein SAUR32-like [Cucurbita moschata]
MRTTKGFRLKIKLPNIFKRRTTSNPFSKLFALATASFSRPDAYSRLNRVRNGPEAAAPKGYLAVHVGGAEDERERHLVPLIYFNHPMFGKLLQAAERIYGFQYPGRIVIPVDVSEFEEVTNCIATAEYGCRNRHSGGYRWRSCGK